MNLPWDKSYFKICFYCIFTFICIYIAKNIIDAAAYTFVNLGEIYGFIKGALLKICSVFSIIIYGFIISYCLRPAVIFFSDKVGLKRTWSSALVFLIMLGAVAAFCITAFFTFDYKSIDSLRVYMENLRSIYGSIRLFLSKNGLDYFGGIFDSINTFVYNYIKELFTDIVSLSGRLMGRLTALVLSIFAAFYMLRDEEKIIKGINGYTDVLMSKKWKSRAVALINDADFVFSGYLRGQFTDGIIMAALISIGLAFMKVPFAPLIGIFSGFSNIIPYFGSITGFVLSVGMALISGEPVRAVYAAVLIIVLQQFDTIFIVPKIVGESVRLNPLTVIISLAAAARLFGIVGMIFAVPTVALIKLRLDRYCDRRYEYEKAYTSGAEENKYKASDS